MPTTLDEIEVLVREHLVEPEPKFWTSSELKNLMRRCEKDLWRSIVDLKGEHYLTINATDVSIESGEDQLTGVPADVHKVYNIEPVRTSSGEPRTQLVFTPLDWNHKRFSSARAQDPIDASAGEVFYAILGAGAPVGSPTIKIAPTLTSAVSLNFAYVPTLDSIDLTELVIIPGEADNAIVAWTVAYARAKEREDRAPDGSWLSIYGTEKEHLLQSLGLRQLQEPKVVDGMFDELW